MTAIEHTDTANTRCTRRRGPTTSHTRTSPTASTSRLPLPWRSSPVSRSALYYLDLGKLFLPTLLVLMAIKFVTVVSLFMHLRFDNKIFSWLFYSGLFLACSCTSPRC